MKKLLLIIGLLSMAVISNAEESGDNQNCGASRKFPRGFRLNFTRTFTGGELKHSYKLGSYDIDVFIEAGEFLKKFNWSQFSYTPLPKITALAWEHETITEYIGEDNVFNYEVVMRNPDSASLSEFKVAIIKILNCRYGSIKIISEGNDFIEYEADGKHFYHGFIIGQGLLSPETHTTSNASFEFIGYSDLLNFDKLKNTYMMTFHNNRTLIQNYLKNKNLKVLT